MLNRIDEWKSDLNFLSATKAQRYTALLMSGMAALLWAVRGWDSGIGSYGISLHYSVFVIYGLEYAILNWWMDNAENIQGIRNLIISVSWTIFSVAVFEWYWGLGYALLHGELWVLTPMNPVYTELIAITLIGILGGIYAIRQGIRLSMDGITMLALLPALVWFAAGFPQTCYPSVEGTVIYIENNLVHLFNVLAKAGLALATAWTLMNKRPHEMLFQFLMGSLCALIGGLCARAQFCYYTF